MLGGLRSVLGLVALVGGAATTIAAAIALLGGVSFLVFLTWVGVAYLVLCGATLLVLTNQKAPPTPESDDVVPKSSSQTADLGLFYFLWLGFAVLAVPILLLMWIAGSLTLAEAFQILGVWAIIWFGIVIYLLRGELVTMLRELGSTSRACPRCGHPVRSGVMTCPHCGFDFRTIG